MIQCPTCPVQLQPLDPSTTYVAQAQAHAEACGIPREEQPAHGPVVLVWGALVAHHMTVHPNVHLGSYLEHYLDS